jgi:4-hydroxy-tetrahydrodipicolinate reductase
MSTRIAVTGAKGRMGQVILQCAKNDPRIEVVAAVDMDQSLASHLQRGVVVVDFTVHNATPGFVDMAVEKGCPVVIGTTGFTYSERNAIVAASKSIPIVLAPNMSVGVNLLFILTQVAASVLKEGFDVEIIEKHHRMKKDSPSGTAARLAELVAQAKGKHVAKLVRHGRYGDLGERTEGEIGVHSVRGGGYVGDHDVIFASPEEVIQVSHHACSREIFAKGALLAAKWVENMGPGLYDMPDVLGLQVSQPL